MDYRIEISIVKGEYVPAQDGSLIAHFVSMGDSLECRRSFRHREREVLKPSDIVHEFITSMAKSIKEKLQEGEKT